MTRVRFYHNAHDPLALACELASSACLGGRKVALRVTDEAHARQLDRLLWSHEPLAFIPHVMAGTALAAETPVIIGRADDPVGWPHDDLLFNLATDVPPGFAEFRLLIEIVGQGEADRLPARSRWMHYRQNEFPLQAFDAIRREAI